MAVKQIDIPDIGLVNFKKHPGSKTIKISLPASGGINVTMPKWVPYNMAIKFVVSRKQWILDNQQQQDLFYDGQVIGKSHTLRFAKSSSKQNVSGRIKGNEIWISYPKSSEYNSDNVQAKARELAIRALRLQAEDILPGRLRDLAAEHGFEVKSIAIRNLKARWGSCNSKQEITLNLYLMLLPWELIDYVILHELTHTKAMHHGKDFWDIFKAVLPDAKRKRKIIHNYKPAF